MSRKGPPPALPSAAVGAMLRAIQMEIQRRVWRGTREVDLQVAMATMMAEVIPSGPLVPYTVHREYILREVDLAPLPELPEALPNVVKVEIELRRDRMLTGKDAGRLDLAVVLEAPAPNVIAIELKVAGGTTEVAVQVQRYARHPDVAAVVLATTAPRLAYGMPKALAGKPVIGVVMRRM